MRAGSPLYSGPDYVAGARSVFTPGDTMPAHPLAIAPSVPPSAVLGQATGSGKPLPVLGLAAVVLAVLYLERRRIRKKL